MAGVFAAIPKIIQGAGKIFSGGGGKAGSKILNAGKSLFQGSGKNGFLGKIPGGKALDKIWGGIKGLFGGGSSSPRVFRFASPEEIAMMKVSTVTDLDPNIQRRKAAMLGLADNQQRVNVNQFNQDTEIPNLVLWAVVIGAFLLGLVWWFKKN